MEWHGYWVEKKNILYYNYITDGLLQNLFINYLDDVMKADMIRWSL
ncbi:hypothetical protein GM661_14850 [Iocasia frigidifontis]|uniref:Uncharacterized protein n=1 Tax=Iocasia fonsfrigidae TaxID=2682810 RepID=A0A8A7KMS2_9FIRM|nr:hypothetical protein [Iocasia fonsfrigidae]QTL99142.1 hypothetical protein GM661_14850 [Iocasia fonsfrigidae]